MISKNIIFGKRFVRFLCFFCLLYPKVFLYYHLFPIPPALFYINAFLRLNSVVFSLSKKYTHCLLLPAAAQGRQRLSHASNEPIFIFPLGGAGYGLGDDDPARPGPPPGRLGGQVGFGADHHPELLVVYLAIAVLVHRLDHLVDLLVGDLAGQVGQDKLELLCCDTTWRRKGLISI